MIPIAVYVTVMSFPAEGIETAYRNHIEDVRAFLETRHAGSYAIYNCSERKYRSARFDNRVSAVITFNDT